VADRAAELASFLEQADLPGPDVPVEQEVRRHLFNLRGRLAALTEQVKASLPSA
jgi:hypothetical protein